MTIGLGLTYGISEEVGGIFTGVYPIAAYLYFTWSSRKYSKNTNTKWNIASFYILLVTLLFVIGILFIGLKENPLQIHPQAIEFTGSYAETLKQSDIKSIELVNQLPSIVRKSNGFAIGKIRKGYFKTKQGETIKLILNADTDSYILFTKTDGKKLYFASKEKPNRTILNEIKTALPNIEYK